MILSSKLFYLTHNMTVEIIFYTLEYIFDENDELTELSGPYVPVAEISDLPANHTTQYICILKRAIIVHSISGPLSTSGKRCDYQI